MTMAQQKHQSCLYSLVMMGWSSLHFSFFLVCWGIIWRRESFNCPLKARSWYLSIRGSNGRKKMLGRHKRQKGSTERLQRQSALRCSVSFVKKINKFECYIASLEDHSSAVYNCHEARERWPVLTDWTKHYLGIRVTIHCHKMAP